VKPSKRGIYGGWRAKVLRVTEAKLAVSVFVKREKKAFLKEFCYVIPSLDDEEEAQIASAKLSRVSDLQLAAEEPSDEAVAAAAVETRARQKAVADAAVAARRAREEAEFPRLSVQRGDAGDGRSCLGGQLAVEKKVDGASRHGYACWRGDQDDADGGINEVRQGGGGGVGGPSLPRGGAAEGDQEAGWRR
jgi:hypothetical protein